jgi:hypothetical protein
MREGTGRPPRRAHLSAVDDALRGRGEVLLGDGWAVRAEESVLRLTRGPRSTRSSRDPAIWTEDATSRDD